EENRHQRGEHRGSGVGNGANAGRCAFGGPCEQRKRDGRIDRTDEGDAHPHRWREVRAIAPQEGQQDERANREPQLHQRHRPEGGRGHAHEHERRPPDGAQHQKLNGGHPGSGGRHGNTLTHRRVKFIWRPTAAPSCGSYADPPTRPAMELPMILYYLTAACSLASYIRLLEAGQKFEASEVDRTTRRGKDGVDLTTLNPRGYVPVLVLDDGQV